jgi:hydrogenase maturation protein HypF
MAIRQPWRIAVAMIDEATGSPAAFDELPLMRQLIGRDVDGVRRMVATALNTPRARGVGRYFDAIGAIVLGRTHARYEGQVAFELNMAADPTEHATYDYFVDRSSTPSEIDFRPVVRGVVRDIGHGVAAPVIAARFHNTLANAAADVVRENAVASIDGPRPAVVLTGGCFQNVRLAERTRALLEDEFDVYLHRQVPPGDGGIALGQAAVAAALRG